MKRVWTNDELLENWTLYPDELKKVTSARTESNQLGFALLLKWFQYEGKFPVRKQDVPTILIEYLATQLNISPKEFKEYRWGNRTFERQRAQIRQQLGFRETTVEEAQQLTHWLVDKVLPHQRQIEALTITFYAHCREQKLEPPTAERVERIIRSALHTTDNQFYTSTITKLTATTQSQLDKLLETTHSDSVEGDDGRGRSVLHELKQGTGAVRVESLLIEVDKLQKIEALELPLNLFTHLSPKVIDSYYQRVAVEDLHEIQRHPAHIRYSLLAIFCWKRRRDLIDTLVDLLIELIHRLGIRAERKVDRVMQKEFKQVSGKNRILYEIAEASVENPTGSIQDVIYPIVNEQTLQDLINEFKLSGSYTQQIQMKMRSSYGQHYRRMVPDVLNLLTFRSNNAPHKPLIHALDLFRAYADSKSHEYPVTVNVPIEGVVPSAWLDLVVRKTNNGQHVNRISYELCVLRSLRDKLRCKEIWVEGANRYRNPDEDLPQDFIEKRETYYASLNQPLAVETFIADEKQALTEALTLFNAGILQNPKVKIGERNGKGWITLSPLEALPEPINLRQLHTEVKQRWAWTSLLDMLKETDLRIHFTDLFKSATVYENLTRPVLQKRLLLCLYGLGTNTGLNRVASGDRTITQRDLLYVRRRFINRDSLRAAIQLVVNETLKIRGGDKGAEWWGTDATTCASDSKKFGAWDQNLLTEWHIRYRGPGIMVYWHVEKKSLCIYSQVKRCSSSEVAAMIEGVLRHCSDMTVEKNYVDTHGQSEIGFAFTHLLGFQLMPRLKGIQRQRFYLPDKQDVDSYSHLQPVLTRGIQWDLIRNQYDEMIKYSTALRLGTAETEAILQRFTRSGLQHPTYRALAELGKVRKTIFLCQYLHDEAIRREVNVGLNVIENWNSANGFIFFGKGSEIATNKQEEQELAILSLHLLQICMVYINTLMLQEILSDPAWQKRMGDEDRRGLTPLFYSHVNPYGEFKLDMEKRLAL